MKAPACLWQYFDAWKRALLFKKKKKNLNFDEKDHAEDKKKTNKKKQCFSRIEPILHILPSCTQHYSKMCGKMAALFM